MIPTLIFWLIVFPSSLAFISGLIANFCQIMLAKE